MIGNVILTIYVKFVPKLKCTLVHEHTHYYINMTTIRHSVWLSIAILYSLPWQVWGQEAKIDGVAHIRAHQDKLEHLEVYLVAGIAQSLSLSGAASDRVLRYRQDALKAEPVAATYVQGSQSWRIDHPEVGWGYFVARDGQLPTYHYLIGYTPIKISDLAVATHPSDPCTRLWLSWHGEILPLSYTTPSGVPRTLPRGLRLRYVDRVWRQETFVDHPRSLSVEPGATGVELEAPLGDTAYTIEGDQWNERLGLDFAKLSSSEIETSRLEVHTSLEIEGHSTGDDVDWEHLSAPTTVHLRAQANDPVAAKYQWRIERVEDGQAVFNYTGREASYTFDQSGQYRIRLDVTSRTGRCIDNGYEHRLRITESSLEIPNAFSPGSSEGVNEVLRVRARSLIKFDARIFSPSGQELYRWYDPQGGWDGRYRGRIVPSGVYYYVITAEGSDGIKYHRKGAINVLKTRFDTPTI